MIDKCFETERLILLEITNAEMKEINYLIPEVDYTTGYNTPYLEGDGMQHLDGTQATCCLLYTSRCV